MKKNLAGILLALLVNAHANPRTEESATNQIRLTTISLSDQHGQQRRFAFPQPGVSVLTVADKKGSEQIAAWVQPLKTRFPDNLPIEGIADVSAVPRLLRAVVRKQFAEKLAYPVMLDWEGKFAKELRCKPGGANIFLLSTNGAVLVRLDGAADEAKLKRLERAISDSFVSTAREKPN